MSTRPSHMEDCAAINAAAERTAQRVERFVWITLAIAIGAPLGWWLAVWATCPGVC